MKGYKGRRLGDEDKVKEKMAKWQKLRYKELT